MGYGADYMRPVVHCWQHENGHTISQEDLVTLTKPSSTAQLSYVNIMDTRAILRVDIAFYGRATVPTWDPCLLY